MVLLEPHVTLVVTLVKFQSTPQEHKAKLSHEAIAAAAAFEVCPHLFIYWLMSDWYILGRQSI